MAVVWLSSTSSSSSLDFFSERPYFARFVPMPSHVGLSGLFRSLIVSTRRLLFTIGKWVRSKEWIVCCPLFAAVVAASVLSFRRRAINSQQQQQHHQPKTLYNQRSEAKERKDKTSEDKRQKSWEWRSSRQKEKDKTCRCYFREWTVCDADFENQHTEFHCLPYLSEKKKKKKKRKKLGVTMLITERMRGQSISLQIIIG